MLSRVNLLAIGLASVVVGIPYVPWGFFNGRPSVSFDDGRTWQPIDAPVTGILIAQSGNELMLRDAHGGNARLKDLAPGTIEAFVPRRYAIVRPDPSAEGGFSATLTIAPAPTVARAGEAQSRDLHGEVNGTVAAFADDPVTGETAVRLHRERDGDVSVYHLLPALLKTLRDSPPHATVAIRVAADGVESVRPAAK